EEVLAQLNLSSSHDDVKYTFENSAFRGFVASMKSHCLDLLDQNPDVSMVEQSVHISSLSSRAKSPWGLQRVSSATTPSGNPQDSTFTYNFNGADSTQGKGVDIYIVDSGVNVDHQAFGGRAKVGFTFDGDNTDGDGHGTHVAGTAAADYFGVASGANIWAVKVLGADGAGSSSATLAGMNWVINHNEARKKEEGYVGAVMSMSWGLGSISTAVDTAIKTAVGNGIHASVAAGNNAVDSCSASPSSSGGAKGPAITVGSMDISNKISKFSNSGACNDVYAPGENILSTWNTANNMINFLSGTSMACPHVTGVIAYLMGEHKD
ncbi:subtilisin-like protein, partial [Pseudovirgaria hyperparasitica]